MRQRVGARESWLAERLARHYANTNYLHDLLRAFAHLSGTVIHQADGGLTIRLQPPDLPLHHRALAGLCADLNLGRPVDRALLVKLVFYAGDEGGIVCDVTPSRAAKQVFIVSLTTCALLRLTPCSPRS